MNKEQVMSLLLRFTRGGIAGAASVMIAVIGGTINQSGISSLANFNLWLASLTFSGTRICSVCKQGGEVDGQR